MDIYENIDALNEDETFIPESQIVAAKAADKGQILIWWTDDDDPLGPLVSDLSITHFDEKVAEERDGVRGYVFTRAEWDAMGGNFEDVKRPVH